MTAEGISRRALIQYGVLGLPLAFAGLPMYLHAPDYYVTEHGLSIALMGLVLTGARVLDAVQDPLIGALSDRWAQHRQALMMGAGATLAIGLILLFNPPPGAALLWFALSTVLATTAYGVLSINLSSLGALWSKDPQMRTRIASYREGFTLLGVLAGVTTPVALTALLPKSAAFSVFAIIVVLVVAAALWGFWTWARPRKEVLTLSRTQRFCWQQLMLPRDPRSRRLLLIHGICSLASALPAILVLWFVRDRLGGSDEATGGYLLLYFGSAFAGMGLWTWLASRWSKVSAWMTAMALTIVAFVWAFFLQEGDFIGYGVVCFGSGLALGGELALPASILADYLDPQAKEGQAGRSYAWLSLIPKVALGLASGIALPLLESVRFTTGEPNSTTALMTLSLLYALLPCSLKAIGVILCWRWRQNLDPSQQNEPDECDQNTLVVAPDTSPAQPSSNQWMCTHEARALCGQQA